MSKKLRELLVPAGIVSSVIIGAGIFSLPYIFYQSGLLVGFLYLAFFAIIMASIHLMYAEIVCHTPGEHRFVGFARIYLGKAGFYLSFFTTILGILLALLIYLTLSTKFLNALFDFQNNYFSTIFFWLLVSLPALFQIRKIGNLGAILTLAIISIVVLIFTKGVEGISAHHIYSLNLDNFFLPVSAVLFALAGRSAISTARGYLKKKNFSEAKFDTSILIGSFTPAALYSLFVLGVVGISGSAVTPDAISGLGSHPWLLLSGAALGVIALANAYIFLSVELRQSLIDDLRVKRNIAYLLVVFAPILLFLSGFNNLLELIGLAGGFALALDSVLVVIMWHKLKKRNRPLTLGSIGIVLVFLFAMFQEFWKHIQNI